MHVRIRDTTKFTRTTKTSNRSFSGLSRRNCMKLRASCAQTDALDDGNSRGIARLRNSKQNLEFMVYVANSASMPDLALTSSHRNNFFVTPRRYKRIRHKKICNVATSNLKSVNWISSYDRLRVRGKPSTKVSAGRLEEKARTTHSRCNVACEA